MAVHSKLIVPRNSLEARLQVITLTSTVASALFLWKLYRKSRLKATSLSIFRNQFKTKKEKEDFYLKLRQIVKLLIPRWTSPEVGYLTLTSGILVCRAILDAWNVYLGTMLEASIITMDRKEFNRHLLHFAMLMPAISLTNAVTKFSTDKLARRFRSTLTRHITQKYMTGLTFYTLSLQASGIDQLVAQDVSLFASTLANLYSRMLRPMLDIIIYFYGLSHALGPKVPIQMILYLIFGAAVLLRFRKPISRLTAGEQELEGEYRLYHNRVIVNAEEIAFYGGNQREKETLNDCFRRLMEHADKLISFRFITNYMDGIVAKCGAVMWGYYTISRPYLAQHSPELANLTQEERLAGYYKAGRMLTNLALAIARLVIDGREISKLAGYTSRVHELMSTLDHFNSPQSRPVSGSVGNIIHADNVIKFDRVPITTPNGDVLIKELNMTVKSGQNVLISGPNGCGKSSLFRILGELWPLKAGTLTKPVNSKLFYVPQRPYMTVGTLRDQIIYPDSKEIMIRKGMTDEHIVNILRVVKLEWIVEWQVPGEEEMMEGGDEHNKIVMGKRRSLDDVENWIDVLSGGQKQRIAMARLLYHRPQFAILDECTSAVSVDVEGAIYTYCRQIGITLLTVTHRRSLWKYHEFVLHMDGRGNYDFREITNDTEEFGS